MMRYQVFVKWRVITPPELYVKEWGKLLPSCGPDEVGEDEYHPDKMIFVGSPFDTANEASSYAISQGWNERDWHIKPFKVLIPLAESPAPQRNIVQPTAFRDRFQDRITGTDAEHFGLDEIVAKNVSVFHMERMDDDHMWFVLYDMGKGIAQHVDLYAREGKLIGHVREPDPF